MRNPNLMILAASLIVAPEVVLAQSSDQHSERPQSILLSAESATLVGPAMKVLADQDAISGWSSPESRAVWEIDVTHDGVYDIQAVWALENSAAAFTGNRYEIELDDVALADRLVTHREGYVNPGGNRAATTGSWSRFSEFVLGQVTMTRGQHQFVFRPAKEISGQWLSLRQIRLVPAGSTEPFQRPPLSLPEGFTAEVVADLPLIQYPMMACLDDRGRLLVAESSGSNDSGAELLEQPPHKIVRLEDSNADGVYDRRTVFADGLTIPNGAAWVAGALYVCSAPYLWRFEDRDDDGVAELRSKLPIAFNFNGNHSGMHGPSFGPDGRLYWCGGVHGWNLSPNDAPFTFTDTWPSRTPGAFSIWPDGTEPEAVGFGGRANPVEITHTENGEPIGSVAVYDLEEGRHDALLHWIDGGVFNLTPGREEGVTQTGQPLIPLQRLGHVAPSGVAIYRSQTFGNDYQGNLFLAQFNTHSVQRFMLQTRGSSLAATEETFLSSPSAYAHFTDVLEDADGSLLVIDTGGWFVRACPTSRISKPEINGAIYRVRRTDASVPADPRGLSLDWTQATDAQLADRLGDDRMAVRDRATSAMVERGGSALPALSDILRKSSNVVARRQAVWALCRLRHPSANELLRVALHDDHSDVRRSAAHSLATLRDLQCGSDMQQLLTSGDETEQRLAATALGRIADATAIPAIISALGKRPERFLEHACILALIRIGDTETTALALNSDSSYVRRSVLIALDQMGSSTLSREQVLPLLNTDDRELQLSALNVIAKHPDWSGSIADLLLSWLTDSSSNAVPTTMIKKTLTAFVRQTDVQQLIAEKLVDAHTSRVNKKMLLETLADCQLDAWPEHWDRPIRQLLRSPDEALLTQTLTTIFQANIDSFDSDVRQVCADGKCTEEARVAGYRVLAQHHGELNDTAVRLLVTRLGNDVSPLDRMTAAATLGAAALSSTQLAWVAELMPSCGPLELPILLDAFGKCQDERLGQQVLQAVGESQGFSSLSATQLEKTFENFSDSLRSQVEGLVARLKVGEAEQAERLARIERELSAGDSVAGRQVFFGSKAACSACHRVQQQGGEIGPNLSEIARIRGTRDLLESILFPSATLARDFETYTLLTTQGSVVTGLIQGETADAVHLRTAQRQEVHVSRNEIEEMSRSNVSIMPQGLDTIISRTELSDLIAYLMTLR